MTVLSNIITPSNVLTTTNTATVTNKTLTSPTVTGMTVSNGTANGVTYLNGSKVVTSGSALTFDGTNLGLGVTPSAWASSFKVLQLANGTSLSNNGQTSYYQIGANNYYDGSNYKYIASNYAGFHRFSNAGAYEWHIAPSGTAGNAISFTQAMTLDSAGNLGIGTSSPATKLHVYSAATPTEIRVESLATQPAISFYNGSLSAAARNWAVIASYNAFGDLCFNKSNALGGNPIIAGTTCMTLDASGNLGIGTTSPTVKLNVATARSATVTSAHFELTGTGVVNDANKLILNVKNTLGGNTGGAGIGAVLEASASNKTGLSFYYDGGSGTQSDGMRLDSSGNLGLGLTPSAWATLKALQIGYAGFFGWPSVDYAGVSSNAYYTGSGGIWNYISTNTATRYTQTAGSHQWAIAPAGTAGNPISFTLAMTLTAAGGFSVGTTADPGAGAIYATGNITAYYSDARLKTVSGKIENALDKVGKLSGVYYTNNDTAKSFGYNSDEIQVGVLAQDVEAVLPQIVKAAPFDLDENGNSKSGENYKTVQYERLVPLLIEAINELQAKVKALESK